MASYIVAGAGILGASAAYHLAKAGETVTLIDREEPAQATHAAAGIICPWLTNRRSVPWYKLALNGAAQYGGLVHELEASGAAETGFARVGTLRLHTDEDELKRMEELAYERREAAPTMGEIHRMPPGQAAEEFPVLDEAYGAVRITGGGRVNGRAMRDALITGAKAHGARVLYGDAQPVTRGTTVTGVDVDGENVEADAVILCTGAWMHEAMESLGYHFLIRPQRAQILHMDTGWEDSGHWPVIMPPSNHYMLAFDGGRIVTGATHENKVGFDARTTAGGVHNLLTKALNTAPGLEDSTLAETRVGFRPMTPDSLPLFGPAPYHEGLFLANGLGASGLTTGPYIGKEIANMAMDRPIDVDPADYEISKGLRNR
ncbi:D-amino acid dehydrogenase small subunit [Salsuginibacillus halophilus]|uniref:D-amino acid dehydrogenase small subunit n=1 Tax=Salsuginibacillus halophilus TaxID=517424 RepID=A0A2P8HQP9_9BACI|nr:FAD-dependent oxidoreductase [Salsuginibacillus halophilus]PSL48539.1 D-amino acid dehydrogenase small subunit [Salsuginibacillus halophilus]